jgi:sterol desaturase/sphingolipid hydroxylase (fatty acid hydroxylase superfamily)
MNHSNSQALGNNEPSAASPMPWCNKARKAISTINDQRSPSIRGKAMFDHEAVIRLGIFTGILLVMILAEAAAPRRDQRYTRRQRWPHNLSMVVVDTLVVRLLFPITAVGAAVMANEQAWGLLNLANLPVWLSVLLGTIALDLAIYFQHRIFHAVPWLWRLHRMHHADLEFDVTTGLRFHPLEIVLSMAIKITVVVALGAPALAVLIFEVILNATSMFNHGNVRLPQGLEQKLRRLVVTPEMHRVHHSIVPEETNSNFGFNLPWWDRVFGTYRDKPAAGHIGMVIGIEDFREPRDLRLDQMLIQPFRSTYRRP